MGIIQILEMPVISIFLSKPQICVECSLCAIHCAGCTSYEKNMFYSFGAYIIMEMMAYKTVEDKQFRGWGKNTGWGAVPGWEDSMYKGPVVREKN